jgi:hypothetical protein
VVNKIKEYKRGRELLEPYLIWIKSIKRKAYLSGLAIPSTSYSFIARLREAIIKEFNVRSVSFDMNDDRSK